MSRFSSNKIDRAAIFAGHAHQGVQRKYDGGPFISHPARVASMVATVTTDVDAICAAWLHDVVEDTVVTLSDIDAEFGERVVQMVASVTAVSRNGEGNRAVRKAKDLAHYAKGCALSQTIKIADIIDNTVRIVDDDPEFAPLYLEEKRALLEALVEGNRLLWDRADEIVSSGLARCRGKRRLAPD